MKVLLYVRHQNLQQLTENNTIKWSTLYSQYLEEINTDLIDLLRSPVYNEEDEITDEESQEE